MNIIGRWILAIILDVAIIVLAALLTAWVSMTIISDFVEPILREIVGTPNAQVSTIAIAGIVGTVIGWIAKSFFSVTRKTLEKIP